MLTLSTALFPASSSPVIVYVYLTLFCSPVSSNCEARPLKTVELGVPSIPGARSIAISVVSGEAVQDRGRGSVVPVGANLAQRRRGRVELECGRRRAGVLPALSRHVPLTVVLGVSGPEYVIALHDAMPEPASEPWIVTWTEWLYQPFASGGRSKVMLSIEGPAASYFTVAAADAVLPALSEHDPADAPGIVPDEHDATPDRLSLPDVANPTGWMYQSPTSGPRESAMLTDGGVASYLIGPTLAVEEMLPALSVHVPETVALVVSGPPYVVDVQPARPDTPSIPLKAMSTAWLYQPFASGPRVAPPEIVGGVASRFTVADSDALAPLS